MFADRDVFGQGDDVGGFAFGVAGERNTFSHPDHVAVFLQALLFDNVIVDFSGQHLTAERGIAVAIFGMGDGVGIHLDQFLPGETDNITKGVVYLEKTAFGVGKRHADSGLRKCLSETLLAGAKIQPSLFGLCSNAVLRPSGACQWMGYVVWVLPNDPTLWVGKYGAPSNMLGRNRPV